MKNLFSINDFAPQKNKELPFDKEASFDIERAFDKDAGRKRIKDRGIHWVEKYGERSDDLKKRFDKIIGPGSYYRFEGKDYTTNSDYFIVIGPSITRAGQKSFFAGIKKMPPEYKRKKIYAPSGKYFPNIMAAVSYASQKWGLPYPQDVQPYSSDTLTNIKIPRRLKG